ncbi:cytidine/deoxycytidylate deaminase family protein [Nonomuraea rosea]|uniref:Cytidine/deoxycytidylate deaminase family protein n=1 Tax=Nonomuraea rosea TaxID=638574 RepID=A0ABP6VPQ7_9ACTN
MGEDDFEEIYTISERHPQPIYVGRDRPDWDTYFLNIAADVALRGDCVRDRVGAVLVNGDRRIVGTGYNGVRSGLPGCIERPCERVSKALRGESICPGYSDCRSTHAEANVLLEADWKSCQGANLYTSRQPCTSCVKLIRSAGVSLVIYPGERAGYPNYMSL